MLKKFGTFGENTQNNRFVFSVIILLTIIKFIVAASTPLAFDEALYWRYSNHLAAGFIDHPFLNPLMIKIGTSLWGNTPIGVRFMAVVLSLPASWAVWRAAFALFADERLAVTAALFFNLTIVMTVGAMVATSDEIVVVTTSFILLFLAKLNQTGRGAWWLAVGGAIGLGFCAKYTTAFFAIGILIWLIIVPERRKWLLSPWAWAGGLVSILVFSPVLLWNAHHGWESFVYQSGRLTNYNWTIKYLLELVGSNIILATPPIFILGCIGTYLLAKKNPENRPSFVLILSMLAPMGLYFIWLSTHERVQGNWPEPIYPAVSVAAAYAAHHLRDRSGALAAWSNGARRAAVFVGLLLASVAFLEATTGFLPLGRHDPRARVLGVGWPQLSAQIDVLRARAGAKLILTSDYTLNSWAKFYLPAGTPVEQFDERVRWTNEPAIDPSLTHGTALYICGRSCWKLPRLAKRFRSVTLLAQLGRYDKGYVVNQYNIYEMKDPIGPIFDSKNTIPLADHDD